MNALSNTDAPVYPCAYREHECCHIHLVSPFRFIPVHTGNIVVFMTLKVDLSVYPCVYREHGISECLPLVAIGLSLCIQGTSALLSVIVRVTRFIPVYTGNMIR